MTRPFLIAALAMATLAPGAAWASSDGQLWTATGASGKIAPRVDVSIDEAVRFSDAAGGLNQIRLSAMIGYHIAPHIILWVGYVHAPDYAQGHAIRVERRAREQISAQLGNFWGGTLSGVVKVEQRWRDTGSDTGWRVRGLLKWTRPFRTDGKTALVVSHESFLNLDSTDWGQIRGYDQMRNFIGINTPLVPRVKIEMGYLNRRLIVRGGADESDHVASVALGYSF
jgi:hypothetical protein